MFEKPVTPTNSSSEELLDARKKFEAEKLTRRSALKKFGITSGMALFGMFAADDLARMVIKKMEEHEATRQIAETVAHEFKNAGIAFADSSSWPDCRQDTFPACWKCCDDYATNQSALEHNMHQCSVQGHTFGYCSKLYDYDKQSQKISDAQTTCNNLSPVPCLCNCIQQVTIT